MSEFSQNIGKLILRVTVGGLMLFHGVSKIIHGVAWMQGPLGALHLPFFIAYGSYIGEVVAPVLIILGILTRASGLVLSFDLVVAFILVSHSRFLTLMGGGWGMQPDAFFFLTGITIFFLGAGKFSVTGARGKWN